MAILLCTEQAKVWWDELSPEEKRAYLFDHPNSKYGKGGSKKSEPKDETKEDDTKEQAPVLPAEIGDEFRKVDSKSRKSIGKALGRFLKATDAGEKAKYLALASAKLALKAGLVGGAVMLGGAPVMLAFPRVFESILSTAEATVDKSKDAFTWAVDTIQEAFSDEDKLREHVEEDDQ